MQVLLHADDFGLSSGINQTILDAADNGVLESLSIIPNGYAFAEAVNEWKKRPHLRLAVHLNLFEGVPISQPDKVPLLVNEKGAFKHSFFSLWMRYALSSTRGRTMLKEQVATEYAAQLQKVRRATGLTNLFVDSHIHFHMIPFVFDVLCSLRSEYSISSIRLSRERFFLSVQSLRDVRNYLGSNLIKHLLLKILARRNQLHSEEKEAQYFIGVLFSGCMTVGAIQAGLQRLPRNATVEVLLHPGQAKEDEHIYWADRERLWRYYSSASRKAERTVLQSKELYDVLKSFA